MIKLLRRIRQSLLEEGNLRKYLLYAFGEILLVMAGILLALQVNNMNQKRLAKENEMETISSLKNELVANRNYLIENVTGLERTVKENGMQLLKLTGPKPSDISQERFLKMVWWTSRVPPFAPKTATFNKIINSSDLNLITDDSMKVLLIDYQAKLDWVEEDYEDLRLNGRTQEEYEKKHLVRLNMVSGDSLDLFENIEKSKFLIDPKQILSDKYFENLVVETLISYNYVYRSEKKLLTHLEQMQNYIETNYKR